MRILLLFLIGSATLHVPAQADWPQFRGPEGQGVAWQSNIPLKWSGSEHVRWVVDVPGNAWSSPIVQGDRV